MPNTFAFARRKSRAISAGAFLLGLVRNPSVLPTKRAGGVSGSMSTMPSRPSQSLKDVTPAEGLAAASRSRASSTFCDAGVARESKKTFLSRSPFPRSAKANWGSTRMASAMRPANLASRVNRTRLPSLSWKTLSTTKAAGENLTPQDRVVYIHAPLSGAPGVARRAGWLACRDLLDEAEVLGDDRRRGLE